MAAGKKPDYEVFISSKGKDDKNFYHVVGAAWNVAKGGISIKLLALPVDGSLILFPPKPDT